MKQIEYTDYQKKFLEILENVEKIFKPSEKAYDFQKEDYSRNIKRLRELYGIEKRYQTLREYLKYHSKGAYHHFYFTIQYVQIDVIGIEDFRTIYNESLLDKYYVTDDTTQEYGNTCENYECKHFLELAPKED